MKESITIIVLVIASVVRAKLVIEENWNGPTFFNHFSFFTEDDPTHGTVDYISRPRAEALGLARATREGVFLGVDSKSVVGPSERGRKAVRIESLRFFGPGRLFVVDVDHVPEGCGVWPAAWFCGADWPNGGEADLYEATNTANETQTTLHTKSTCDQSKTGGFTGTWATGQHGQPSTDCWVNAPGQWANEGCGIIAQEGTAGEGINRAGGGVFAMQWNSDGFRAWFFNHGKVPKDLVDGNPQPDKWILPYSRFDFGTNCSPSLFGPQTFVINTALCGDWAGSTFAGNGDLRDLCSEHTLGTQAGVLADQIVQGVCRKVKCFPTTVFGPSPSSDPTKKGIQRKPKSSGCSHVPNAKGALEEQSSSENAQTVVQFPDFPKPRTRKVCSMAECCTKDAVGFTDCRKSRVRLQDSIVPSQLSLFSFFIFHSSF